MTTVRWVISPGRLLAFGPVLGLGAWNGGWSAVSWGWASLVLCAGLALVALAARDVPRAGVAFLGGLAALAAWTALSATWSQSVPSTLLDVERDLVYLAGVSAALAVRGDELEDGVLGASVVLCGWNLLTRLHGYDHGVPGADAQPIGYANGLGLVAAIGCVLAARRRSTLVALAVVAPALVLSGSDGSYLATAAGLAVAWRPRLAPLLAIGVAVVVLAGLHGHERARYWDVALADARAHPALGSGSGTFAEQWVARRSVASSAHDAHSLELQTLAELGTVGLVLVLGTVALPFASGRGVALGAYAAWVVQSGIDWDWQLPAVTLAGLFCGVAALDRSTNRVELGTTGRATGVGFAAALAALAFAGLVGNAAIARGRDAVRSGDAPAALAAARRAHRWAPWSAAPWQIVSDVQGGDVASLRRAVRLDPDDWSLWADLARTASGAEARRAATRAARLNPLGPDSPSG
jgi:hypothetical protein